MKNQAKHIKPNTPETTPMQLFPTYGSLKEVFELGEAKLPIENKNELFSFIASYHNTLLRMQQQTPSIQ